MEDIPVKNQEQFAKKKLKEMFEDENLEAYKVDGYDGTDSYLVINEESRQFEVYNFRFKKVDSEQDKGKIKVFDAVGLVDSISYVSMESAEVDKFATVTHFKFNTGITIKVTSPSDETKRFTQELNKLGINTILLERKWYNKILGFRTKKKWKMAIATFAYLMMISVVAGMFTGGEEPAEEEVVASEETTEEVTEEPTADEKEKQEEEEQKKLEEEKAEKEAKEKEEAEKKAAEEKEAEEKAQKEKEEKERKEAEEKKKEEEENTPENQITDIIHDTINEEKVSELIINDFEDGYFVNVTYDGTEGWSNESTIDAAKADMSDVVVALSKTDITFRAVDFNAQYTFVDSYGEESTNNGVQTSFSGETVSKIQFDEGYEMVNNLEDLVDTYSIHPGMR